MTPFDWTMVVAAVLALAAFGLCALPGIAERAVERRDARTPEPVVVLPPAPQVNPPSGRLRLASAAVRDMNSMRGAR